MKWPWTHDGRERHVAPEIERASAEVYGRLVSMTEALEQMVEDQERELRGDDGG